MANLLIDLLCDFSNSILFLVNVIIQHKKVVNDSCAWVSSFSDEAKFCLYLTEPTTTNGGLMPSNAYHISVESETGFSVTNSGAENSGLPRNGCSSTSSPKCWASPKSISFN